MSSGNTGIYIKMTFAALFWGATFIAGRYLAVDLPPAVVGWWRYVIATVVLVALMLRAEGGWPRLSRAQFVATLALGLTGVTVYNMFFFAALERIPASRSALLVALNPIITTVSMALFFDERVRAIRWFGVALAFVGTVIVITRGDVGAVLLDTIGLGELFSIAATIAWVSYGFIARFLVKGISPLTATTYASLWGWLGLTPLLLLEPARAGVTGFTLDMWLALAYLGIFSTVVPFLWYYQALMRIGPARTAMFSAMVPVFGAFFGVALLNEPLLPSMVIGGVVATIGVMLASRP
jgi:drug/metabolite transporter (DMT)-like permease